MKCPICNLPTNTVLSDHLREEVPGRVLLCGSCDHGFLEDKRTPQMLKEYYRTQYRKTHKPILNKQVNPANLFKLEYPLQQYRVNKIKRFLTKKMRVLDIGCSSGMFLFGIKPYVKQIMGIDYDVRSAAFASKKCKCTVYTNDIDQTPIPKHSLDLITMFHSLEHIQNPYEYLRNLTEYLRPQGALYIEVPNVYDALFAAYDVERFRDKHCFHLAHLSYFSAKSLRKLLAKAGFSGTIFHSQDYNIINHIHWILNNAPQPSGALGRGPVSIPFRTTLSKGKREALQTFFDTMDIDYKKILEKLSLSANVSFIGRLKK